MRLSALAFVFATFVGGCALEEDVELAPAEPVVAEEAELGWQPCGDKVCHVGTYCCNSSCGWCVPFGMRCPQVVCDPDDPRPWPFPWPRPIER